MVLVMVINGMGRVGGGREVICIMVMVVVVRMGMVVSSSIYGVLVVVVVS